MSLNANLGSGEITRPDMDSEANWEKGIIDPPTVSEAKREVQSYAELSANLLRVQGKEPDEITQGVISGDRISMLEFVERARDKFLKTLEEKNSEGKPLWEPEGVATIILEKQADRLSLLMEALS